MGFGGEFFIEEVEGEKIAFIAAGVGITPLLPQLQTLLLSPSRFTLFWTVRADDLGLVNDAFTRNPGLAAVTRLFVTGKIGEGEILESVKESGAVVMKGRMGSGALIDEGKEVRKWYLCTGTGLRKEVLTWLEGHKVIWEAFDY